MVRLPALHCICLEQGPVPPNRGTNGHFVPLVQSREPRTFAPLPPPLPGRLLPCNPESGTCPNNQSHGHHISTSKHLCLARESLEMARVQPVLFLFLSCPDHVGCLQLATGEVGTQESSGIGALPPPPSTCTQNHPPYSPPSFLRTLGSFAGLDEKDQHLPPQQHRHCCDTYTN